MLIKPRVGVYQPCFFLNLFLLKLLKLVIDLFTLKYQNNKFMRTLGQQIITTAQKKTNQW